MSAPRANYTTALLGLREEGGVQCYSASAAGPFNQLSAAGTFAAYVLFWLDAEIQQIDQPFSARQFLWGNLDDGGSAGWGLYLEPDVTGQITLTASLYAASGLRTVALALSGAGVAPSFVERLILAGLWYDGADLVLSINGTLVASSVAVALDPYVPSAQPASLGGLSASAPATNARLVSAGCAPIDLTLESIAGFAGAHFKACREAAAGAYAAPQAGLDWAHRYELAASAPAGAPGTVAKSARGAVMTTAPQAPDVLADVGNRGPVTYNTVATALARVGALALQLTDVAHVDWYHSRCGGAAPAPDALLVDAGVDPGVWSNLGVLTLAAPGASGGVPPYTYAWTKIAGPGAVIFGDDTSLTSTITVSEGSDYTLRLSVTDDVGTIAVADLNIGFQPFMFGATIVGYLDSDLGVTDVGGKASAWADQSSQGNDLAQAVAASRPAIEVGVDGHTALVGAGAQILSGAFAGLDVNDHPEAYYVAAFTASEATGSLVLNIEDGAPGDGIGSYHIGASGSLAGRMRLAGQPANTQAVWAGHAPPTSIELVEVRNTNAGADSRVVLSVNGVVRDTTGPASAGDGLQFAPTTWSVFGAHGEFHRGPIYWTLIRSVVSTAGERAALYAWLDARYPSIGGLP